MVDKEKELLKLTKFWYDYVSQDHHKDRDCHFDIVKRYSYGNIPKYFVQHYGYITEYDSFSEYNTYEDALDELIRFLKEEIRDIYKSLHEDHTNTDEDYNWSGVKKVCKEYNLF